MKRLGIVVVVVAALGVLFWYGLRTTKGRENIASPLMERQVPEFSMPLFERYQPRFGPEFSLSENLGKPMVINFWASWCEPCKYEAPVLEAGWREYGGEVLFVGVDTLDQKPEDARAFLETYGLSFPVGRDTGNKISIDYGIFGVPETYFVRSDGTLSYKHSGPLTPELLEAHVQALLQ